MKSVTIKIGGMSCVMCSRAVENALANLDGVASAEINYADGSGTIQFTGDPVPIERIGAAVRDSGYEFLGVEGAETGSDEERLGAELRWKKIRFIAGLVVALPLMVLMYLPGARSLLHSPLVAALALPIFIFVSAPIFAAAFRALRNRSLTMDVMYALGMGVAFGASVLATAGVLSMDFMLYETAIMLASFLMLGKYLEGRARGRTSASIRRLIDLNPKTATVVRDGIEYVVSADAVRIGDIVVVRPGDAVPVDGTVIAGESAVDQSMFTGEPVPAFRAAGDRVLGGTINGAGLLRVSAEGVGSQTVLAGIIRLVRTAQGVRPPVQRLADRIIVWFIPVILAIALTASAVWFVAFGSTAIFAVSVLISILVVACPCALGLATPTAITVGIGRGAELGILVKSGEALELSENLDTIVFDKTGTLTAGRPVVTSVDAVGIDERSLLSIAASAEKKSTHPFAEAIVTHAEKSGVPIDEIEALNAIGGKGITARLRGREITIGNEAFLADRGVDVSPEVTALVRRYAGEGSSIVLVAVDGRAHGVIGIRDPVRDGARDAVREMRGMGFETLLVSGDTEDAVRTVAVSLGIDRYHAGVMPDGKESIIAELQAAGRRVAFAGDGINDAPALARANVGIAMGGGTDVAIETGDIVILGGNPLEIPASIQLSRAVMRRVRQNLFWAFAYNLLLVPLAAGLLAPIAGISFRPEFAGLAMAMSSVTVVSLSLMLKRFTPPALTSSKRGA